MSVKTVNLRMQGDNLPWGGMYQGGNDWGGGGMTRRNLSGGGMPRGGGMH